MYHADRRMSVLRELILFLWTREGADNKERNKDMNSKALNVVYNTQPTR
jgi:hypothetical protein